MKTEPNEPINSATMYLRNNLDKIHETGVLIGLTKREYFAALAMQSYAGGEFTGQAGMPQNTIAEWSVKMADALINELNK